MQNSKIASAISLSCVFLLSCTSVSAADYSPDDAGLFGSITVTKLARDALKSFERQDFVASCKGYSMAIDQASASVDLNWGLLQAAYKAGNWQEVKAAVSALSQAEPESKLHLQSYYGQALAQSGQYEEALPYLRQGLSSVDSDLQFVSTKIAALSTKIRTPAPKKDLPPPVYIDKDAPVKVIAPPKIHASDVGSTSSYALTYGNLEHSSEFIAICTYKKYELENDITYFRPPIALFHIDEILKGPPLSATLPIRFEFHEKIAGSEKQPPGWTFSSDKMPALGSKWLIFIENAVPKRGAFDTYHGSYGRQPATEENRNLIYRILEERRGQQ